MTRILVAALLLTTSLAQAQFNSGPRIKPDELKLNDGVANIPDRATFKKLSYQGPDVMIDRHLDGIEFVKFQLEQARSKDPLLYFMNTKTHRAHPRFMRVIGVGRGAGSMRGVLVYRPLMKAPDGSPGMYTFEYEPNDAYSFDDIKMSYELLVKNAPVMKGRLGYYLMPAALRRYEREKKIFDQASFPIYRPQDVYADLAYLPLNLGKGIGVLRLMSLKDTPRRRDVVIYKTLPNEMSRVAGIITGVRQTPLSHVNLRAIQDRVPNAFIHDAWNNKKIKPLIGKVVYYNVAKDGFEIREAKPDEVKAFYAKVRPRKVQTPKRDLSVKKIRALKDVGFKDSINVGVKAANLAAMRKFDKMPKDAVPDGFAIPFSFYDDFMKHNGLYKAAQKLINKTDVKESDLKAFRSLIKKSEMPKSLSASISELQNKFKAGTSIRCRSSTNNEDLKGFSGAGLYSSYTHKPDEGHLSKTIKQVYASLWNYRAFDERRFYHIDHLKTAMGVLVHENFKNEKANGVAVTDDVLYQSKGNYYVNMQVGEDLVTNPEEASTPEELLLDWWSARRVQVLRYSNRVKKNKSILSQEHLEELRSHLSEVHAQFAKLYGVGLNSKNFAMEVELKITEKGRLIVKQARPWVYLEK